MPDFYRYAFFGECIHAGTGLLFGATGRIRRSFSDALLYRGIDIGAKQIERICHYNGQQQVEDALQADIRAGADKTYPDSGERHYVMIDGGMYLTREEKWKEIKLGRIFRDAGNIGISRHRGMITRSEYVCHLGSHTDFFEKLGVYIEGLKQAVFINDGARWIWDWIDAYYPGAVQILDFTGWITTSLCVFSISCQLGF